MQAEDSAASEMESPSEEEDDIMEPMMHTAEEFGCPNHDTTRRVCPEAAAVQQSIAAGRQQEHAPQPGRQSWKVLPDSTCKAAKQAGRWWQEDAEAELAQRILSSRAVQVRPP